jgi:hypothetical protein
VTNNSAAAAIPVGTFTRRIPKAVWLVGCVTLLIVYIATRLHHLLVLPIFIDEALHLTRSQMVLQGHPFEPLLNSKALALYVASLFDPFVNAPFVGRAAVVLIGLIGLSSAMALGRVLHSRAAGLIAGTIWLLCPYLFFYERMMLVDATLAAMATFAGWTAIRMIRTGKLSDAALCGLALALCPFAKATGIIYGVIPVIAFFVTAPTGWRVRIRQIIVAYVVTGLLMAGPVLIIVTQAADIFGVGRLASVDSGSLGDQLRQNPGVILTAFRDYFDPLFLVLLGALAVFGWLNRPRRGLMPAVLFIVPLAVLIVTATQLYMRYPVIAVPGLIVLGAFGFADMADISSGLLKMIKRPLPDVLSGSVRWLPRAVVIGVIAIWAIVIVVPFMTTAYRDPLVLDAIPTSDQHEYILDWSAGYGLRDTAADLVKRAHDSGQPVIIVGLIGSCNTVRLYVPPEQGVTVLCPDVWDPSGKGMSLGHTEVQDQITATGSALVLAEVNGPVAMSSIPSPRKLVTTYARPDGRYTVELYRITAPSP